MTNTIYCVYETTYLGNLFPQKFANSKLTPTKYIGSSSIDKIDKGYRGSVSSKRFAKLWKQELKENPELFEIKILETFETREEALCAENRIQRKLNVVKDENYFNLAIAKDNDAWVLKTPWNKGMKGVCSKEKYPKIAEAASKRDYTGENNTFYGKKHSEKTKQQLSLTRTGQNKTNSERIRKMAISKSKLNKNNCPGVRAQSEKIRKLNDEQEQQLLNIYLECKNYKVAHEKFNKLGFDIAYTTTVGICNKLQNDYSRKNQIFDETNRNILKNLILYLNYSLVEATKIFNLKFSKNITIEQAKLCFGNSLTKEEKQLKRFLKSINNIDKNIEDLIYLVNTCNNGISINIVFDQLYVKHKKLNYIKTYNLFSAFKNKLDIITYYKEIINDRANSFNRTFII